MQARPRQCYPQARVMQLSHPSIHSWHLKQNHLHRTCDTNPILYSLMYLDLLQNIYFWSYRRIPHEIRTQGLCLKKTRAEINSRRTSQIILFSPRIRNKFSLLAQTRIRKAPKGKTSPLLGSIGLCNISLFFPI